MGARGMVSATGSYEATPVPTNPLLKALYYQQKYTMSPIAGLAEEATLRAEGYDPTPWWRAAQAGFHEAKTFDSFVSNPWLAFALNVGADPVTWIPGTAIAKGGKMVGAVVGADKAIKYVKGKKIIDQLDVAIRSKVFGGPHYEFNKRNPKAVRDALAQRNIDFEDFINTFVSDTSEQMVKLVQDEPEMFALNDILRTKPYAKSAAESVGRMDPDLIGKYNQLSAGGKLAYRLAWDMDHGLRAIKNSREMRNMDAYKALRERIAEQYKSFTATPHEALANEAALNGVLSKLGTKATAGDIVRGLTPDEAIPDIVDLIPDIGKAYKGLATAAVRSRNLKDFLKAVNQLEPGEFDHGVAEMINRDAALHTLRELSKMYTMSDLSPEAVEEVARLAANADNVNTSEGEQILAWLIQRADKGKSDARKAWNVISQKPIVPAFTRAGHLRDNAFPMPKDMNKVLTRTPLSTDYRDLPDFFQKTRMATRMNEEPLADALAGMGKAMPPELEPVMGLDEIQDIRNTLLGMREPEAIEQSQAVWEALNKNRFNGMPLNVIRNANVDQIAKVNMDQIEARMVPALQVDGIATARAVAADNYHRWLFKWLHGQGLLLPADQFDDLKARTQYFKGLKAKLSPEDFAAREREGFAKINAHPIFSGFALPKTLAKEINSFTNVATSAEEQAKFFQFWGRYQGLWKAYQLAIYPSYHARNAVSNVWNNFLFGLGRDPRDIQYYAEAIRLQWLMRNKLSDLSPKDAAMVRDLKRGVIGGEYAGELSRVLDDANPFQKSNWLTRNPVIKFGFNRGRNIEDNARIAHYLKARNGKAKMSHLDAVKSVQKYLFDWRGGLSKFEDKYLRNFLVPFYGWTRFNLPLQIEMLAMQPGKFSAAAKLRNAVEKQWGGPDPDTQFQADWFKQGFNVRSRFNDETGTYEYFFLDQWLPAADISKILSLPLFRDVVTQLLTPAKSVGIELLFNWNLFKKRKIAQYEGQRIPLHIPGGKTIHVDARLEHLLRQFRAVNEVDRFFDETTGLSGAARWQRIFIGRTYPYDPVKQEEWWEYKINTQIRELEGYHARALDKNDEGEAERIQEKLDKLYELQDYYK